MAHDIDQVQLISAIGITVLALAITISLYYRSKKTGIKALNLLIYFFTSLTFLGLFELISILFHETFTIFMPDDQIVSLLFHPVRFANLVAVIILFVFAESIMSQRSNIYRLSLVITLLSGMLFTTLINLSLGRPILTNEVILFANDSKFEEFIFDLLQFYSVAFVTYTFTLQLKFSKSKQFRTYILFLLAASLLYLGAMTLEVLEHLIPDFYEVDAFISAFPTIVLLAYVYLRYPNMIYLVPTDVKFLQLINLNTGVPIYVAEFEEDHDTMNFLIGPGLSSIRTMLSELLTVQGSVFQLKSFSYSNGFLIFIEGSDLFALLQTDRLSRILLTSLRYFITEFEQIFNDQISNFRGEIRAINGVSPDDVLRRCIPIVDAIPILSSMEST